MRSKPQRGDKRVQACAPPLRDLVLEHPWDAAVEDADAAYRAWCEAPSALQRADAYAVYRAAEYREAAAAAELRLEGERF